MYAYLYYLSVVFVSKSFTLAAHHYKRNRRMIEQFRFYIMQVSVFKKEDGFRENGSGIIFQITVDRIKGK